MIFDKYILSMYNRNVKFEWNSAKASANFKKHGVGFEEASSVFFDENTKVARDPDNLFNEDRFLAVGYSAKNRILIVVHCYRESDEVIRIISARKLSKSERKQFEEGI